MGGGILDGGSSDLFGDYFPDIASAGVWANGSDLVVVDYFPDLPTGGLFGNGTGLIVEDDDPTASGGVYANGSADVLLVHRPILTPAGVRCGGLATRTATSYCLCAACCEPAIEGSGGILVGGTALVDDSTIVPAGLLCNGSAFVDVPTQCFDWYGGFWLLNEAGNGTANEFKDRSKYALHGTGGAGVLRFCPQQVSGVFCRQGQSFDGAQFIGIPHDSLCPKFPFTITLWGQISGFYQSRTWFSRGSENTSGAQWTATVGYTILNSVTATVQTPAGTTVTVFGRTIFKRDTWYHVGVVWTPASHLAVYVNGVLDTARETTESVLAVPTIAGAAGAANGGAFAVGNVQDIRLHSVARSPAWLAAEFDNYCSPHFVEVS